MIPNTKTYNTTSPGQSPTQTTNCGSFSINTAKTLKLLLTLYNKLNSLTRVNTLGTMNMLLFIKTITN